MLKAYVLLCPLSLYPPFCCSKIGKLTLARLLVAHDAMMSYNSPNALSVVHCKEVLELYRDLMKLDPPHSQFYEDEYSLVLLKQVIFFSLYYYCRDKEGHVFFLIWQHTALRENIYIETSYKKTYWERLLFV